MAAANKLQNYFILITLGGVGYFITLFDFPADNFNIQQSTFSITGKCTLKNWEIISKAARGEAEIMMENDKIKKINSLKITIPANSFESESYTMNNHAEEALKAKKYPTIIFLLNRIEQMGNQNNKISMKVSGELTVAGITKSIQLNVTGNPSGHGILFQGRHPLKMSDFYIKPPIFILGGIKTEDEVVISFHILLKQPHQIL